MEPVIVGIDVLWKTGFDSWMDFYCSVCSESISKLPITYGYEHPQTGKGEIKLDMPSIMLKALAMEEGKQRLKKINLSSFSALWDQIVEDDKQRDQWYYRHVVIKSKNGACSYQRILFNIVNVHRMAELEKTIPDYLVYEEEEKKNN